MSKIQIAKIYNNGEYKIFDCDGVFSVVIIWNSYDYSAGYSKKKQKKIGDFPTLSAALYNVYSLVSCGYRPF